MPANIILPNRAATPQLRVLAKAWAKAHKDLPAPAFGGFITDLIHDPSPLRKTMGGILLGYMPVQRRQLSPTLYDDWLDHTNGWAAVDAICYNNFTAAEILENFGPWKTLITRLAKSDNANKRRGAIVLLTKPVKQSTDPRLSGLAFDLIDLLSGEKDILITKAVSWLLRNLTQHHAPAVRKYLKAHRDRLPAIAIRETTNKLNHGIKSPKIRKSYI
ncbi:MAG TPA: DNA alkylation repair protein [Puia sp.]|nr:DNA alkylation repair protein [Puia sp.]